MNHVFIEKKYGKCFKAAALNKIFTNPKQANKVMATNIRAIKTSSFLSVSLFSIYSVYHFYIH